MNLPEGDFIVNNTNINPISNVWKVKSIKTGDTFNISKPEFDILVQEGKIKINQIVGRDLKFTCIGGCCK